MAAVRAELGVMGVRDLGLGFNAWISGLSDNQVPQRGIVLLLRCGLSEGHEGLGFWGLGLLKKSISLGSVLSMFLQTIEFNPFAKSCAQKAVEGIAEGTSCHDTQQDILRHQANAGKLTLPQTNVETHIVPF